MMNVTQKTLGEITEARVEQTGPNGREFTYVDIGSIALDTKRIVEPKVLPVSKAPSRAKQVLKVGDVLVSMTRPNRNAVALVPPELDGAIGSTGFQVLRAKDAEPGFLFYAVQTNDFIDALCEKVQGALYPAVRPRDVSSFKTFLPTSIPEQRRIVAEIEKQFTRLEAGVAALRRVQANLKRYRAAVLKAACEGRLVPTEAELHWKLKTKNSKLETGAQLLARILTERRQWFDKQQADAKTKKQYVEPAKPDSANLTELPDGWTWGTWNQISNWVTYGFTRPMPHVEQGIPIVTAKGVNNSRIIFDDAHVTTREAYGDLSEKDRPKPGDILITKDGTIGRAAVVDTDREFCINQSVAVIWLRSCPMERKYLLTVIESELTQKPIWAKARGVAIQHLSITDFAKLGLPIPPLAEQTRIVAEVERRLSVVEELESVVTANLQRATRLRQSILHKAFAGELVATVTAIQISDIIPPLKPEHIQQPNSHFARALLSAEIVHRLHIEPTFGRIKHQKIFHLCEHIAQIEEIQGQYHREAAGPLDNKLIYANEAELKKQKWYQEVRRESYGHAYQALAKAGGHRKYVERYWADKLPTIEKLIELMRKWDTERCEIFCTAYAAWNDLILWGKQATEDNILHEILERWHNSKRRFPKERWLKAIAWMKKEGFVPTGFGKPTKEAK